MDYPTTTRHLLMVRPASFGYNAETAQNNAFQDAETDLSSDVIAQRARAEFDGLVAALSAAGVDVTLINDRPIPPKSDAVFPNNHISFHPDGRIFTYPMFSEMRRLERWGRVLPEIEARFEVKDWIALEQYEQENRFLEGTGSMILDHHHRIIYACRSIRTDEGLVEHFGDLTGYKTVIFDAIDHQGIPVYHTNVMMALGETFVVICKDVVKDAEDWARLEAHFVETDKEIVEITYNQMLSFAGNMLQVRNNHQELLLIMSSQAYFSLTDDQKEQLEKHNTALIHSHLDTIEKFGGGSARCMIAEVFLTKKGENLNQ